MRDIDIRVVLDQALRKNRQNDLTTLIRHELGIEMGTRRVDVAVLNGHFAGWEIKSDQDTLRRLTDQAASYSRVMDYMTLVTTEKYLDKASKIVPEWWGITEAVQNAGGIRLVKRRARRINRNQDSFSLSQLLWRGEALDELKVRDKATGLSSASRYEIWARLCEIVPRTELKNTVLTRLKQRHDWTGGQLSIQYDGSSST